MPHILAAALYGGLGYHFWNSCWRWKPTSSGCGTDAILNGAAIVLCDGAIHAYGKDALFSDVGMRFSFSFALSPDDGSCGLHLLVEKLHGADGGLQPWCSAEPRSAPICCPPFSPCSSGRPRRGYRSNFTFWLAMLASYSLFHPVRPARHLHGFTERAFASALDDLQPHQPAPDDVMESLLFACC